MNYKEKIINYLESLSDDEQRNLADRLQFAWSNDYGDWSCSICGHPLKYAWVLDLSFKTGLVKDSNEVFIGRECFKHFDKMSTFKKYFERDFNSYKKIISEIKSYNDPKYKQFIGSIKEAVELREKLQKEQEEKEIEENFEKIKNDPFYLKIKNMSFDKSSLQQDFKRLYLRGKITDNQLNYFKALVEQEIEFTDYLESNEYKQLESNFEDLLSTNLTNWELEFVESIHSQSKYRKLSEKQLKIFNKIFKKYF